MCFVIPVTEVRKESLMHFGRSMRVALTRYLADNVGLPSQTFPWIILDVIEESFD
jgi:hypothetical protein